jgi:hypothetical protein
VPYDNGKTLANLAECVKNVSVRLREGGTAFVIGPAQLGQCGLSHGLRICWEEPVEQLPPFRMHRTILPKAKLKAGLTLFQMKKI